MGKIVCETHDNITHLGVGHSRGNVRNIANVPASPDTGGKSGTRVVDERDEYCIFARRRGSRGEDVGEGGGEEMERRLRIASPYYSYGV